jgi:hypothetical protein
MRQSAVDSQYIHSILHTGNSETTALPDVNDPAVDMIFERNGWLQDNCHNIVITVIDEASGMSGAVTSAS